MKFSEVKTPGYILRKYRNAVPSLTIHLHPTHFRFEQQDGSFSYNSPMKAILEHIKSSTVPHDMIEEFSAAGVKFYEGGWDFESLWPCIFVDAEHRVPHCASTRSQKRFFDFFCRSKQFDN